MSYSRNLCVSECVSVKDCDAVLVKDVKMFNVSNEDKNHLVYYLGINTWCMMLGDYSDSGSMVQILRDHILYYGLIPTIKDCSEYADVLIQQMSLSDDSDIVLDCVSTYGDANHYGWLFDIVQAVYNNNGFKEVLQILRYLKRLTLDLTVDQGELEKLESINNSVKMRDRRGYFNSVITPYMQECAQAYCKPWRPDAFSKTFSNGAAADAKPPRVHKVAALSKACVYQVDSYGSSTHVGYPSPDQNPDMWTVSPILVPKNLEKKRVIAPEHAFRQWEMSALSTMLDKNMAMISSRQCDYPIILLHNQSVSRIAAQLSANPNSYRRYATVDMSYASDFVSEALVREIFGPYASDICQYTAKFLKFKKKRGSKRVRKYLYSTAGSRMTFPVESIVFASIAYAATCVTSHLLGGVTLLRPIVYGDDTMVDERAAPLILSLLEYFGFKVNVSKSFCAGYFKESCGVESWSGMDVSSSFFPRHDFQNRSNGKVCADDIAAICDLQHRLFNCRTASSFLIDYVRDQMPRMTSHFPSTDCSDLWELDAKPVVKHVKPITVKTAYWESEKGKGLHGKVVKKFRETIYPGYDLRYHYAISSKSIKDNDAVLDEIWEQSIYMEYLQKGPLYLDDYSRRAGASTSRKRATDRFAQKSFYKLVPED